MICITAVNPLVDSCYVNELLIQVNASCLSGWTNAIEGHLSFEVPFVNPFRISRIFLPNASSSSAVDLGNHFFL